MIPLQEKANGIRFDVRVHPGAKKNAVTGIHAEALKISLSTPPVDGRANEALVRFLAEALSVPRSAITIVSGQTSRNKRVQITGMRAAQAISVLTALLP